MKQHQSKNNHRLANHLPLSLWGRVEVGERVLFTRPKVARIIAFEGLSVTYQTRRTVTSPIPVRQ